MPNSNIAQNIAQNIRDRKTMKILADPAYPITFSADEQQSSDQIVRVAIADAGWAPFHYDRSIEGISQPWRAHMLGAVTCRHLALEFPNWFSDLKPSNKLPSMLAACGCLVLVTWIPQFRSNLNSSESNESSNETPEKQIRIDDEHLSATAAMIQNLLLILTSQGLGTYWSSGGQLGSPKIFDELKIDRREQIAGAVFVEYPNPVGTITERIPGKHRENRSEVETWMTEH